MSNEESKDGLLPEAGVDGPGPLGNGNGQGEPVDAASQSVARALRTSFLALKVLLLVLVVVYLCNGWFTLPPGSKAVVIQFGQIRGLASEAGPVLDAGVHWHWPWPIAERIIEDTERVRPLKVDSFWFFVDPQIRHFTIDKLAEGAPDKLTPGLDGYLLTAEQEIVHLECTVRYKIDDLVKYVRHVNPALREVKVPGENRVVPMPGDAFLVRQITEWACTQTIAAMRTDEVVRGDDAKLRDAVRRLVQQRLDELDSGLQMVDIILDKREVPLQVRRNYQMVVQSELERQKLINEARARATQQLSSLAGPAHKKLREAIENYELARTLGKQDEAAVRMQEILALLEDERTGGRVASAIGDARGEGSRREKQVQAEIGRFTELYPVYQQDPALFLASQWAEAKQEILSNPEVELMYLPHAGKEIRLNLGHNPGFLRDREIRARTEQQNQ